MGEPTELTIPPAPDSGALIGIIERVVTSPDIDIEKVERLLDMQERIIDKNAAAAFNASMAAAQAEMPIVHRGSKNLHTSSSYTKLDALNREIVPVYTKHGFGLTFGTADSPIEKHIRIICDALHRSGHLRQYHFDLPLDDRGAQGSVNKTAMHAAGSTISYGRRYLTMLIFNISTSDDNDGNTGLGFITEAQVKTVNSLLAKLHETTRVNFFKWIGVETSAEIDTKDYGRVILKLKEKAKK